MKKLVFVFIASLFLTFASGLYSISSAQDAAAADTLGIDDMDPILYHPEEEEEEACTMGTGMYVGIGILVIVAGAVIYRVTAKKKK